MVKVIVDGREFDLPGDEPILSGLRKQGEHMPGMCLNPELDPFGSCRLCLIDVKGRKITACSTLPSEGMELTTISPEISGLRKTALELMLSDHYGDCVGPCQKGCPAHSDVQGYLALIANGRIHEAVKLMKDRYILPATLGRVCPAFCEEECRRELVEGPVAIRQLKRYAADEDLKDPWMPEIPPATGRKVAVVGGGPAGLSNAFYLRSMGHDVTIFEAMPKLGGWTRYGIPRYRLPKDVLDRDIATVIDTGIDVRCSTRLGKDVALDDLSRQYDAVFLGIGAWKGRAMGVEGEDLPGVFQGIDFLSKVNQGEEIDVGKRVVVVGGGNTAMDVARTCRRLGCEVTLTYRRSEDEMPAARIEIEEAKEEGIRFMLLCNPVRVIGNDRLEKLELIAMELGEPDASGRRRPVPKECSEFTLDADSLILAIGQYNDDEEMKRLGVGVRKGLLDVDRTTLRTTYPNVFAGGDAVLGPSTVIESIEQGRRGALMMDMFMKGKLETVKKVLEGSGKHVAETVQDSEIASMLMDLKPYDHWKNVTEADYEHIERSPRSKAPIMDPDTRSETFSEVEGSFDEDSARAEVMRCMSCGCMDVFECKLREYSTIYGADQYRFGEGRTKVEIDLSHPHIVLDNNKCVLCGQCVNHTQDVVGEGVLDFCNRGVETVVSPPPGKGLSDMSGVMMGEMIDVCPTGAFSENTPHRKPGPWDTRTVRSICSGCGVGCEMGIEVYDGDIVRARSIPDTWNRGHLCDPGRFERLWAISHSGPKVRDGESYRSISPDEASSIFHERSKGMAIVLGGDVTLEEAEMFRSIAAEKGMPIGSTAEEGLSTATYMDISRSRSIYLALDINGYPVLKPFLNEAIRFGASIVMSEEEADLIIADAPYVPGEKKALVMHRGLNDAGLLQMGIKGIPKADSYLFIGTQRDELLGYTIALGHSEIADMVLPYPAFANRSGSVVNSGLIKLTKKGLAEEDVKAYLPFW